MDIKRLILTGCSVVVLSAGTALAGPCDTTGRISVVPLDQPLLVMPSD